MKNINLNIRFYIRIIIPAIISILLFIMAIFFIIIPHFQNNIMNGKREMINELTNSAWSILSKYEQDETAGILSRDEAQKTAVSRIQYLRYGEENKDYFWITDMHPTMVMHPYRPDLNGKDLNNFEDPHGKKMFVEFVNTVKEFDHGFVDYMWQWKDDSLHIVPKLSYVRVFKPWNWVIGTGIYIEDVNVEIKILTRKLVWVSSSISLLIALLLFYISKQSINIEQKRITAENNLNESKEKYKTLVEATTEGLLMIIDGRISYSNSIISKITGFNSAEFDKLRFSELVSPVNNPDIIGKFGDDLIKEGNYELNLKKKSGDFVEVFVTSTNTKLFDKLVNILIIKDITHNKDISLSSIEYQKLLNKLNIGFFRVRLDNKGKFIFANETTIKVLGFENFTEFSVNPISDFFVETEDLKITVRELIEVGSVQNKKLRLRHKNKSIIVASITLLANKSGNEEIVCDGMIEDISEYENQKIYSEKVIGQLIANSFLIHHSISDWKSDLHTIDSDVTINRLVREMNKLNCNYLFLTKNDNEIIGVITNDDILNRIYKLNLSTDNPAYLIMSSPVISVFESETVSKAMKICDENRITHILVKTHDNMPTGVFDLNTVYKQIGLSLSLFETQIEKAANTYDLKNLYGLLQTFIKPLIKSGISTEYITTITSDFFDILINKVIDLMFEKIGKAPVPFAFVNLGSEGRKEETLFTDQDNAIIYDLTNLENTEADKKLFMQTESFKSKLNSAKSANSLNPDEVKVYFNKLGTGVCEALNEIGYSFCRGKIMVNNEQWCQPIDVWKKYFRNWIKTPDPQSLIEASIFFDFRSVYGQKYLTKELRVYIDRLISKNQSFLYHLAQNTFQMKIPQFSGYGILTDKSSDLFDVKNAVNIIVLFARTYALQNNIYQTNTVERLKALCLKEIINEQTLSDLLFSYNYLMSVRLKNQVKQIENRKELSNIVNTKNLSDIELIVLKKVVSQLSIFQTKIGTDFRLIS